MRLKTLSAVTACMLTLAIFLSSPASGIVVRAGEGVSVSPGEVVTEDLALFGSELTVNGYVESDVIAFCRSIEVPGIINQDLMGAAETVEVTGQIGDDLRVAARNVNILGPVGDDVIAFCERFTLGETSLIGGEARTWCAKALFHGDVAGNIRTNCQSAEFYGHVGGDVLASAFEITMAGLVDGDVDLQAQNITLVTGCVIAGNLKYTSLEEIDIPEGVQIRGDIKWEPAAEKEPAESALEDIKAGIKSFLIFFKLAMFIGQILVGLILIALFRKQALQMTTALAGNLWRSLGIGLIFFICVPILSFVLMLTIIGFPPGLLGLLFYVIVWYLSPIVVGTSIGGRIVGAFKANRAGRLIGGMILGLTILRAISFVPVLGFIVQLFVILFGMGAIVLAWRTAPNHAVK